DVGSADIAVSDYVSALRDGAKGLRIGIPRAHFYEALDGEVAAAVEEALGVIGGLVGEIRDVEIEIPADRAAQNAEAYAYHAQNVAQTPELYQPETVRRILWGADISAVEYIQQRRELDVARRYIQNIFADVDLLVTPTTPIPAPAIADLRKDTDALRPAELRLLRNTRPFNVWGLPAVSLPCGFTKGGLPIGLQIAGPQWREDLVLRLAQTYESATAWHKRHPAVDFLAK
ncbi:MAG: amidase, partial [Candidatus Sulfotelmatobacter sp.]